MWSNKIAYVNAQVALYLVVNLLEFRIINLSVSADDGDKLSVLPTCSVVIFAEADIDHCFLII